MSQIKRRRRVFVRMCRENDSQVLKEIRGSARKMSRGDGALAEDLEQEGMMELWRQADERSARRRTTLDLVESARRRMRRYMHRVVLREERLATRLQARLLELPAPSLDSGWEQGENLHMEDE